MGLFIGLALYAAYLAYEVNVYDKESGRKGPDSRKK